MYKWKLLIILRTIISTLSKTLVTILKTIEGETYFVPQELKNIETVKKNWYIVLESEILQIDHGCLFGLDLKLIIVVNG